jgi:hypothetical protein
MSRVKTNVLLLGIIFCCSAVIANGQFAGGYGWGFPLESPGATVIQTVGVTEITIKYHRPSVKGRTIWGCQTNDVLQKPGVTYPCLVPDGQVWRAGANDATTIHINTDVKIQGQQLPAGTYSLFMIPSQTEWTIIFNKRDKQWGAFTYNEKEDALRVKVVPQTGEHLDRLQFSFPETSNEATQVELRWEKMKVGFQVSVDTGIQSAARARSKFDWTSGWFAADYFYKSKSNLDEALRWINASIALQENAGNVILKARILAEFKRFDEAIQTAERAMVLQKAASPTRSTTETQKLIDEWKKLKL